MSRQQFHTVQEFIAHVGRDEFKRSLGYSPQLISRAVSENVMPARWFLRVRDLCSAFGVPTPEHLFKMDRRCLNTQYANDTTSAQVRKSGNFNNAGCKA